MLELRDFFHLPQVDTLIERMVADEPGLTVVAGLDPRPLSLHTGSDVFLPSGRLTIFRILMHQLLEAHPSTQVAVVAEDKDVVRIPRRLRRQIKLSLVQPPLTYAACITNAMSRRPGLLVIDRLCEQSVAPALKAARIGLRVLAQLDTVFRGAGVVRHLLDLGAPQALIADLRWVIAVARVPTLCPRCKQPTPPDPAQREALDHRYPTLSNQLEDQTLFRAAGCPACQHTGRAGDVAVFDVFRVNADPTHPLRGESLLSLEAYMLELVARGQLPLADLVQLDTDQLRRTYNMLTASERTLADANVQLKRKLAELEAANRVLQDRTEAVISLQDVGHALISFTSLDDLAARVCRHARDLCGAARAILYYLRSDETAEVLAVSGWEPTLIHRQLDAAPLLAPDLGAEPTPFNQWPPGVPQRPPDVEGIALRAGLRVPLVAQGDPVGLMVVHTEQQAGFAPGEVALLQTFANQAALAVQRAGLIEQLQEKIAQLEAAQAELVQKERMEREMELARQVQQSVLPRIFPLMPGYRFGARNRPARQVGGDFYDVFLLDGDRFGLVIADVSDKGMPAALYMALTRSLLLAEARREGSPREVLKDVHRLLLELGQPDMFVTVFYGIVEASARRLTYVRAGHDRPLLLREREALSLGGEGTFIGFPDLAPQLSEEQIDLLPGDRLVLYTDGLSDLLAPDGRPFGLGRFKATLLSHATLSPDALCRATFADLLAYQGATEQYDDMTMLVVEVQRNQVGPLYSP